MPICPKEADDALRNGKSAPYRTKPSPVGETWAGIYIEWVLLRPDCRQCVQMRVVLIRAWRYAVTIFVIVAVSWTTMARAAPAVAVDSVGITVSDMETALAFYTEVLPFQVVSDREVSGTEYERLFGVFGLRMRIVRLTLGTEQIELIDYIASEGRPIPPDSRSNDEWFQHIAIVASDMERAYAQLRKHRVTQVSPAPQRLPDWNADAGGIEAFYFRDPDGNNLEILTFPPDKGNPRWHRKSDRLFLGIDHTAIVVRDTESALLFYRDGLGMEVKGQAENYGIEQERLNNVFGARLRITAVGGMSGPAIEFLEYLTPRTGRPMPDDTHANDLWHWQIQVAVDSAEEIVPRITAHKGSLVSPGAVHLPAPAPFGIAVLARGPAGHALLVFSDDRRVTR